MKVLIKRDKGLEVIGEGEIFSKSQLKLNELDANIGMANGIQQAQMKAKKMMSTNPSVQSASADTDKIGQNSTNNNGIELKVPVNANGKQLAQAERMAKNTDGGNAQITFTKPNSNGQQNESRIVEMRRNSISFTKSEMSEFLKEL